MLHRLVTRFIWTKTYRQMALTNYSLHLIRMFQSCNICAQRIVSHRNGLCHPHDDDDDDHRKCITQRKENKNTSFYYLWSVINCLNIAGSFCWKWNANKQVSLLRCAATRLPHRKRPNASSKRWTKNRYSNEWIRFRRNHTLRHKHTHAGIAQNTHTRKPRALPCNGQRIYCGLVLFFECASN